MAVINVSPGDNLATAWADATSGDHIALAAGTYQAGNVDAFIIDNQRTGTALDKAVTIRAADPLNRPVIRNRGFRFRKINGVTIKDLDFLGTTSVAGATTPTGGGVPAQQGAVVIREFQGATVQRCRFDYYRKAVDFTLDTDTIASSAALLEKSEFTRISMDGGTTRATLSGFTYRQNVVVSETISAVLYPQDGWHPDAWQVALDTPGLGPHSGWLFEDCLFVLKYMKGPFIGDKDLPNSVIIQNLTLRNIQITSGRLLGIGLNGVKDCLVDKVLMRQASGGPENTQLAFGRRLENIEIRNTVLPRAVDFYEGNQSSADVIGSYVTSGLVISGTAVPTGHVPLVVGSNVGVFDTPGETQPTQPTIEAEHGRFAAAFFDANPAVPGTEYARVLRVPTGSPAGVAAGADPTNYRWLCPARGINEYQPFRTATPSTSGGAWRFEMQGLAGVDWTVGPNTAYAGIVWSYRRIDGTLWSADSSYVSNGDLSPDGPPVGTLTPYLAGQWSLYDVVEEGGSGFFTARWATSFGAPTPDAIEWTTPSRGWLPTRADGVDGNGRTIWRMMPSSAGGVDHLVAYDEPMLDVQIRYFQGDAFSGASADAKSFEGPDAPSPPGSFNFGDRLTNEGDTALLTLGGRRCIIPEPGYPALIPGDVVQIDEADTTFRVRVGFNPPPGADWFEARYAGHSYRIQGGEVTLTKVSGQTLVLVRGVNRLSLRGGPSLFFFVTSP